MSNISIPLIDCSSIANGDFNDISIQDFNAVAQRQQLGAVMTEIGMCNLVNHGLDVKKVTIWFSYGFTTYSFLFIYYCRLKKFTRCRWSFFKLPTQTKLKYRKCLSLKSSHGYLGTGDQKYKLNRLMFPSG